MKKSSFIFLVFIFFLFLSVNTRKCGKKETNYIQNEEKTENEPTKSSNNNLKYSLSNRYIDFSLDGDKLTMNFNGVINPTKFQNPFDDFKVIYIVRFFDKEKLGIDSIKAIIETEKPLYQSAMVKLQDQIAEKESWEVDIKKNDKKDQIVQLIAEASSKDGTERFIYESFVFKYDDSNDKKFIFWLIYGGMVGIVLLIYCIMHIYIFFKGEDDSRPSLKVNDISAVQNEEERASLQENTNTTS